MLCLQGEGLAGSAGMTGWEELCVLGFTVFHRGKHTNITHIRPFRRLSLSFWKSIDHISWLQNELIAVLLPGIVVR